MKKIIKVSIYAFYILFFSLVPRFSRPKRRKFLRVGLFSVTQIKNTNTAGDASIIEFCSIFQELICQTENYNLSLFNFKTIRRADLNVMITRDIISFVVLDILRAFGSRNYQLIYYATDVFSNRVDAQNPSVKQSIYVCSISVLEKLVWRRADFVFANRKDESDKISSQNHEVRIVPAKSRAPTSVRSRFPDKGSGLKFIFVGASGNVPNRRSIETFLRDYWPIILRRYPLSSFKIVGGNWDKFIAPTPHVTLTGFMSDNDLVVEYSNADFSICYLDYGAGVKGKVLEAMEYNTVALGNAVAFEGIDCEALVPMESAADLVIQIESFLASEVYAETIKRYRDFLAKNYSRELIEVQIHTVISAINDTTEEN